MSASALAIQKNNEQSSTRLSRELRAELEDDLTKMKRQYQGLLMNMEEQKRKRMNQTRVIRNIRERIKEIEGGLKYINQKLGKKDE